MNHLNLGRGDAWYWCCRAAPIDFSGYKVRYAVMNTGVNVGPKDILLFTQQFLCVKFIAKQGIYSVTFTM